jgi:hypothetical protein
MRNISAVKTQGKNSFRHYTKAAEALGIGWRIVIDADALDDNALDHFCALAQVERTAAPDQKRAALRKIGVAVLTRGEIEDYYPHGALAAIAGCAEAEVPQHLARHRMRQDGTMRKMGDTLRDWLRPYAKPEIARLVAAWLQGHPEHVTDNLSSLIRWTVD